MMPILAAAGAKILNLFTSGTPSRSGGRHSDEPRTNVRLLINLCFRCNLREVFAR